MGNNDNENIKILKQLYEFVAEQLLTKKQTAAEVQTTLIEKGIDQETAKKIVVAVEKQIQSAKKHQSNRNMLFGALWLVGGIVVTAITYSVAEPGGTYVVAWGAIAYGLYKLFIGLFRG